MWGGLAEDAAYEPVMLTIVDLCFLHFVSNLTPYLERFWSIIARHLF